MILAMSKDGWYLPLVLYSGAPRSPQIKLSREGILWNFCQKDICKHWATDGLCSPSQKWKPEQGNIFKTTADCKGTGWCNPWKQPSWKSSWAAASVGSWGWHNSRPPYMGFYIIAGWEAYAYCSLCFLTSFSFTDSLAIAPITWGLGPLKSFKVNCSDFVTSMTVVQPAKQRCLWSSAL